MPGPVARIDRGGDHPAGQLVDLAPVAGLQEPEEQVDRPGLAAPGLRRLVPLALAEEPVGVRGLDLPGEHARMLQELLHRDDLAADRAVGHAMGQPGQHVLGHQVLLIRGGLAGVGEGPRGPQVTDHSQRHAAPRLQQSRIQLAIAENRTGIPTQIQGSASDTPAGLSCHLTCYKGRPAPARARTNCRQVQHSAMERQLARRLTDHALGRGARLTQVQVERGGSWVAGPDRAWRPDRGTPPEAARCRPPVRGVQGRRRLPGGQLHRRPRP